MLQKESSGEMRDSLIKCKLHIGELYSQFSEIKRYNQSRDVHLSNFVKRKVTTVTFMCSLEYCIAFQASSKISTEFAGVIASTRLDMDSMLKVLDLE